MEGGETLVRNWFVSDSWAVNLTLVSFKTIEYISLHKSKEKLPKEDKDKLKKEVDARLKIKNGNKTCLEKLNELLGQLKSKHTDFEKMKNSLFSGDDGFDLYRTKKPVYSYETKKKIYIAPSASTDGRDIVLNTAVSFNQNVHDIFHELLHSARDNNYKHVQIAEAIVRVEGLNQQKYGSFNEATASDFINAWIGQYCRNGGGSTWQNWLKKF